MGESERRPLRQICDRCLKLEFHRSRVTSDTVLLAYRDLDDALGVTAMAGDLVSDSRTGKIVWHGLIGFLHRPSGSEAARAQGRDPGRPARVRPGAGL